MMNCVNSPFIIHHSITRHERKHHQSQIIYIRIEYNQCLQRKQLLRSGTAIGALVCEAEYAESKPDFMHKLAIAQKEVNESDYWIALLFQSGYIDATLFAALTRDIKEIRRILNSIILTTKQRIGKS